MRTIPKNEALNQVVERAEKRHNDEFIRQQIELRRQEQAKNQRPDIETSANAGPNRQAAGI